MKGLALAGLVAITIAIRALVPIGWMPAAAPGFAISLCTETGIKTAWIDSDGKLHKSLPTGEDRHQPCAFANMGFAASIPPMADGVALANFKDPEPFRHFSIFAIGHGLAAPPPPKTGPPFLI